MARDIFALQTIACHCFLNGDTVQETFDSLAVSQGDHCPSKDTIYRWFRSFRDGKTTMGRNRGSGKMPNAVTDANIAAVSRMVDADPRVTCRQIEHDLGIRSAATQTVLRADWN